MTSCVVLAFALVFILKDVYGSCPYSFEEQNYSCYKILGLKATWVEAKKYCSVIGGDLAVIESETEENAIESMLLLIHGNGTIKQETYWIDGSDILDEGEWRWMKDNGNSLLISGYTHWAPGQPDNAGTLENCLEIRYPFGLMWNDLACDTKQSFICEASVESEISQGEVIG